MLSISSSALTRLAARTSRPAAAAASSERVGPVRTAMTQRRDVRPLPDNFSMDAVKPPPHGFGEPHDEPQDPMRYERKPVTSAHAIDLEKGCASALDSAAFGPGGKVVHGRYGEVSAPTVPLEYLALLRPAAEGAAALREVASAAGGKKGTLLVYGASRAAGTAAAQLADAAGHAVVAVIDGEHSGNCELVDAVKGSMSEPGTAVAEEYAAAKANFRELVEATSEGEDVAPRDFDMNRYNFVEDFKTNLLDFVEYYPSDLPAAVDSEVLKFEGKEKDRANFRTNMDTYLSQFQPGADPIDPGQLEANFDATQYALFKKKFAIQTTAVISGGDDLGTDVNKFAPAAIAKDMCASPEKDTSDPPKEGDYPFEFSTSSGPPALAPKLAGGPVLGAVIEATPDLVAACEALAKETTLRGKAEALQHLTEAQRGAHAAAGSVASLAAKAGGVVRVVGGTLPGFETATAGDADVKAVLDGMALGEDGTSALNFYVQVYRAGDWPVYEAYAAHRAGEVLAGPRQIVVTK
ncbi:hypothetical protein ACHAWF_007083 [Thalassiosira exigua]